MLFTMTWPHWRPPLLVAPPPSGTPFAPVGVTADRGIVVPSPAGMVTPDNGSVPGAVVSGIVLVVLVVVGVLNGIVPARSAGDVPGAVGS